MIRATVLTAIMDGYDSLKPILAQDGAEVDWACLTDSEQLIREARDIDGGPAYFDTTRGVSPLGLIHPTGWQLIPYRRPDDEHPNRAAKLPKMKPWMFTDAPNTVWLDASFHVTSPRFVVDVVTAAAESASGIAQFRHPWRDCYWDEAQTSMLLPKYAEEKVRLADQADAYAAAGMPRHWGLWATGVIARIRNEHTFEWGLAWGQEIDRHSYQDQVGHPYTCWRRDMRPAELPGDHFANSWLTYGGSARHG